MVFRLRYLILAVVLAAVFFFIHPAGAAQAATCTWDGSDDNWGKQNSWTCSPALTGGAVPGANDVVIINSGRVSLSHDEAALSVTLNGGGMNINGSTLRIGANAAAGADAFTWNGGTISGGGEVIVARSARLSGILLNLSATTLTGNGPLVLDPFSRLEIAAGALTLNSSALLNSEVAADASSAVTVNGAVSLAGANLSTGTLVFQSGEISGTGLVNASAGLEWSGGALRVNTTTASLDFGASAGTRSINNCTLTASGAAQGGAGHLNLTNSAALTLNSGGEFDGVITSDETSTLTLGSGQTLWIGDGATFNGPLIVPSGSLRFRGGTVTFGSAGVLASMLGEIASANQAAITLPAEPVSITTLTLGDAAITTAVSPLPVLNLRAALDVGTLNWGGGSILWAGSGEAPTLAARWLNLYASPGKTLNQVSLAVSDASILDGDGALLLNDGALLTNHGTFTATGSASGELIGTTTPGSPGRFINHMFFAYDRYNSGTIGVPVNSSNLFAVNRSRLALGGDVSFDGTLRVAAGAGFELGPTAPISAQINGTYFIDGELDAHNSTLVFNTTSSGEFRVTSALRAGSAGVVRFNGGSRAHNGTYDVLGSSTFDIDCTFTFGPGATLAGLGETVTLNASSIVHLPASVPPLGTLNILGGGSLIGSGSLTISTLVWTDGSLSGGDATTPPATNAANLVMTGGAARLLVNRELSIAGDPAALQGTLSLSHAATLTFNSGGAFTAALAVDPDSAVRFDNSGETALEINGLYLVSGTSEFARGAVNFNSDATLLNLGHTVVLSGGEVALDSGEILPQVNALTLSAGSLGGSDALSIAAFTWSGGALNGSASTPVPQAAAGALVFSGSGARTLDHRLLTAASISDDGAGSLALTNSAAFVVNGGDLSSAATINETSTLEIRGSTAGVSAPVSGAGTLRLVNATLTRPAAFDFEGTLDAQNSTVTLAGGGTLGRINAEELPAGGITADNASIIEFDGGSGSTTTMIGVFDNAGASFFSSGTVIFDSRAAIVRIGAPVTIRGAVVNLPAVLPPDPEPQAFGTLNLSSGQLSGAGELSITVLNWSGGELYGVEGVPLPATGVAVLNISSGADMALTRRGMTVAGALSGSGANLVLTGGASLSLEGGGDFNLPLELDNTSALSFSGAPFEAHGAISGPGAVTFHSDALLNAAYTVSGATTLLSSRVTFAQGAAFGGTLSADAASTLVFTGGSAGLDSGVSLSLDDCPVIVNGASAVLSLPGAPVRLGELTLTAGNVTLSAALETPGLRWSAGTLQGSVTPAPVLTILSDPLDLSGPGDRFLDGLSLSAEHGVDGAGGSLSLIRSASLTFDNGGALGAVVSVSSNSTLRINGQPYTITGELNGPGAVIFGPDSPVAAVISGTYNITGTSTFQAGTVTFSAAATLSSLGGTVTISGATVTDEAAFNNDGAIDIQSGTLVLNNGGAVSGSILVGSGGALDVNAGSLILNASLTGAGSFESGADATINGAFNVTGPSTIHGGSLLFSPAASLTNMGAPVNIGSDAIVTANTPFNNTGAVQLVNATLILNQGGALAGGPNPGEGISVDADSLLEFSGGTLTLTADVSGAGVVRFGSLTTHTLVASLSGSYNVTGASQFDSPGAAPLNTVTFLPAASLSSLGAVVSVNGAVVNLPDAPVSIPSLTLAAGRLSSPGQITAATLNWSGGQIDGAAAAARPATLIGALNASGSAQKTLDGRDAAISGPAAWNGGSLYLNRGALLTSQDAFIVHSSGATLFGTTTTGQPGAFTNTGSFILQTGGSSLVGVPFNNAGTLALLSSQLSLYNGGLFTGSATVDDLSWLRFSLGQFTLDTPSSLTGTGQVSFEFGMASIRGAYTFDGSSVFSNGRTTFESRLAPQNLGSTVTVSGGTLVLQTGHNVTIDTLVVSSSVASLIDGPDPLTVQTLNWSAGTIGGPNASELLVTNLNYTGTLPHTLSRRTLKLSGSAQWTGMGTLVLSQAVMNNLPGATIDLNQSQNSVVIAGPSSGAEASFKNEGTLNSTGAWVAQINAPMTNTGAIHVQAGTLVINQAFVQNAGGTLNMNGGTLQVNSSNKTLNLDGGLLTGSGVIDGSLANQGAVIEPGSPFGALEITGQYHQQAGGTLRFDLNETIFDQFIVHGAVSLGGTLAATVSEPPAITPVRFFPVMTYSSRSGKFSARDLQDLGAERSILPVYEADNFSLAVIEKNTEADLSASLVNTRDRVVIGSTATYTLTVTNAGPYAIQGASVSAAFPAGGVTGLSWTCTAASGRCSSASGSDAVAATLDLSPGGRATITITARVTDAPPDPFEVTAQVEYMIDPDQDNNHARDVQHPILVLNYPIFVPFVAR